MMFSEQKIIQEKGVFYYVYQEIFTGRIYRSGGNDSACHIDGAFLFYRNTDPHNRIRSGMDRLPLRDADRSFQDIRVKAAARARSEAGSHKDEKSVSFGCHSRSE